MSYLKHIRQEENRRKKERRIQDASKFNQVWENHVKDEIMLALIVWDEVYGLPMKLSQIQKEIWRDEHSQIGGAQTEKLLNELVEQDRIEIDGYFDKNKGWVKAYVPTRRNVRQRDRRRQEERRKNHD